MCGFVCVCMCVCVSVCVCVCRGSCLDYGVHWCSLAAGEMLSVAQPFLEQQMHPTVIIRAFRQALEDILAVIKEKIR